ncbi:hypothetical protein ES708_03283 [subsurface metagenome]
MADYELTSEERLIEYHLEKLETIAKYAIDDLHAGVNLAPRLRGIEEQLALAKNRVSLLLYEEPAMHKKGPLYPHVPKSKRQRA